MFEFTGSGSIWIYIDFSNIFHAKYTLGWEYDIENFLAYLQNDKTIKEVCFYWAYDKRNISQYNWVTKLQSTFTDTKFYFYFKKLEKKWDNHKWNVDTEMWFDIAQNLSKWKTLVLFSWDGDFLYIIKRLINDYKKQVVVVSTKWHIAKELINYINTQKIEQCRFVDIKKDSKVASPIKTILKNTRRWLCIPPELFKKIQNAENNELEEFKNWLDLVLQEKAKTIKLPNILQWLQNKNHFDTFKTILFWRKEEKQLLLDYIVSLLS